MQDFDTLRDRVEETAQKLVSAQGERREQTETLVGILRELEEKYAAQEQQVAFYKDRVEPLEQANEQLSLLMGNLLDLIDSGFGEDSLAPMRKASEMATAMLARDMAPDIDAPAEDPGPFTELDDDQPVAEEAEAETAAEPESESDAEPEAEMEAAPEPETEAAAEMEFEADPQTETDDEPAGLSPDEMLDLIDADTEAPEPLAEAAPEEAVAPDEEIAGPASVVTGFEMEEEAPEPVAEAAPEEAVAPDEEIAGPASVVTDFEMEEEALARLEEDIDPAAEEMPAPVEMADDSPVVVAETVSEAIDEVVQYDPITIDEIVGDSDMMEIADDVADDAAGYEDVSPATLELEQEEDVAAGMDDLPEIVQIAAAAAWNSDTEMEAPAELAVDQTFDAADAIASESGAPEIEMEESGETESAADEAEAEAIAAIAQSIEDEANAENAAPPAPADIRSLLLRVEALAKKAEAMRASQDGETESEPASGAAAGAELDADSDQTSGGSGEKQAGAAA